MNCKILEVKHIKTGVDKFNDTTNGMFTKREEGTTTLAYVLECGHRVPMSYYDVRPVNEAFCPFCADPVPVQQDLPL